jgi:hypothetical protein
MALSGRIESVIGGTSVGVETVKVAWFYVAASTPAMTGDRTDLLRFQKMR